MLREALDQTSHCEIWGCSSSDQGACARTTSRGTLAFELATFDSLPSELFEVPKYIHEKHYVPVPEPSPPKYHSVPVPVPVHEPGKAPALNGGQTNDFFKNRDVTGRWLRWRCHCHHKPLSRTRPGVPWQFNSSNCWRYRWSTAPGTSRWSTSMTAMPASTTGSTGGPAPSSNSAFLSRISEVIFWPILRQSQTCLSKELVLRSWDQGLPWHLAWHGTHQDRGDSCDRGPWAWPWLCCWLLAWRMDHFDLNLPLTHVLYTVYVSLMWLRTLCMCIMCIIMLTLGLENGSLRPQLAVHCWHMCIHMYFILYSSYIFNVTEDGGDFEHVQHYADSWFGEWITSTSTCCWHMYTHVLYTILFIYL